jgi:hypothetical protein
MFTNASVFASRLSEVEKITIRGSSDDGLDHLFHNFYKYEFNLNEVEAKCVFRQAVELIMLNFKNDTKRWLNGYYCL